MSKLKKKSPHVRCMNIKIAEITGFKEAMILQQIYYWMKFNFKKAQNIHNDRVWMFYSYEDWAAKDFPFWSATTIRRCLKNLANDGFIEVAKLSSTKSDRTNWYTINYNAMPDLKNLLNLVDNIESQNGQTIDPKRTDHHAKLDRPSGQNGQMYIKEAESTKESTKESMLLDADFLGNENEGKLTADQAVESGLIALGDSEYLKNLQRSASEALAHDEKSKQIMIEARERIKAQEAPTQPVENPPNGVLLQELIGKGVNEFRARRLIKEHCPDEILRQLKWIDHRNCDNPGSYLYMAIVEKYGEPKEMRATRKKEEAVVAAKSKYESMLDKIKTQGYFNIASIRCEVVAIEGNEIEYSNNRVIDKRNIKTLVECLGITA